MSVPVGLAGIALIKALGGWQMSTLQTKLAPAGLLASNFKITGQGLLELFGADFSEPEVIATFGQPGRTYHYHEYTILVWNENLLTRLR